MQVDIEKLIDDEIAQGSFPGIVLLVEKNERPVFSLTRGDRQVRPVRECMSEDTIFDLASLTKPLATALLTLLVCEREKIELKRRIREFLPEIEPHAGQVSLEQLLLHTGGLPPVPDIHKDFPDPDHADRERAVRKLLSVAPDKAPGTDVVYSCTGYLLLGQFLMRVTSLSLQALFRQTVAEPCRIRDLFFNPDRAAVNRIAATEYCPWRRRWIRGEVHDENSWCLGGDGGNAGLFATAHSVLELLSLFTSEGSLKGVQLLRPATVRRMRTCLTGKLPGSRSVGFMMQNEDSPVGPEFSRSSFGHTGFTGTSVWIDPERSLKVVTLTNRVHLGREATDQKIKEFRRKIHFALFRHWG